MLALVEVAVTVASYVPVTRLPDSTLLEDVVKLNVESTIKTWFSWWPVPDAEESVDVSD